MTCRYGHNRAVRHSQTFSCPCSTFPLIRTTVPSYQPGYRVRMTCAFTTKAESFCDAASRLLAALRALDHAQLFSHVQRENVILSRTTCAGGFYRNLGKILTSNEAIFDHSRKPCVVPLLDSQELVQRPARHRRRTVAVRSWSVREPRNLFSGLVRTISPFLVRAGATLTDQRICPRKQAHSDN